MFCNVSEYVGDGAVVLIPLSLMSLNMHVTIIIAYEGSDDSVTMAFTNQHVD